MTLQPLLPLSVTYSPALYSVFQSLHKPCIYFILHLILWPTEGDSDCRCCCCWGQTYWTMPPTPKANRLHFQEHPLSTPDLLHHLPPPLLYYTYGSLTCFFRPVNADQRQRQRRVNWQQARWGRGRGNCWGLHMNVVYHNLINNSHSIINQSKLHHFHLYSSSFLLFCRLKHT